MVEFRWFQAARNRRKKRLRSFRILPEWDCHIAALAVSVSKKARFGGFSFYLGKGFPSGSCKTFSRPPGIGAAPQESARISPLQQARYNLQVLFFSYTTMTKGSWWAFPA